jgi:hypothetical protein
MGAANWLVRKLHAPRDEQVLDLVEGFDNFLNNTSVILLVTVGERSLLLAGDAQAENWSYTLDRVLSTEPTKADATLRQALADVDLYKVGHHGSRNASPKRLLQQIWKGRTKTNRPLTSVLCTKLDVYHHSDEGEVPKPNLLTALRKLGPLHSTHTLPAGVWWFDLEAPTTGTAGFTYTPAAKVTKPAKKAATRRR